MEVSWAEAVRVGATGFGLVFMVLILLAVAIWITGKVIGRYYTAKAAVIEMDKQQRP